MKIATWNINSVNSRIQHVVEWCKKARPDVLCLQETKCVDSRFPRLRFEAIGYEHLAFIGEKAYNGVAMISRFPLDDVQNNFPGDSDDAPKRFIAATVNGVHIVNTYVPHGTQLGSDKFRFKLDWLWRLRKYFDDNFTTDDDVVLCGDLNVAPHEMDVWKPMAWKDKLHFTKEERDALLNVKRWGFVDVFRQLNGDAREYSWWDGLNENEQESIAAYVQMLEEFGLGLGHPYTSDIRDSKISHMRELRPQHQGRPYRALYAFDPRRMAILLIGGDKTGIKRWYDVFVPIAERIYEEHLIELRVEGLTDG